MDRQKRAAGQRPRQLDAGGFAWAAGNLMSPTTLPDSSIPTPSTGPRHYRIRCVCQRNEPGGAMDAFMVQWYVRSLGWVNLYMATRVASWIYRLLTRTLQRSL